MKVVPVTVGPVRASGAPSLESCTSTLNKNISDSNIAGFNTIAHVNVTSDPVVRMELASLLVSEIDDGVGTIVLYVCNSINNSRLVK